MTDTMQRRNFLKGSVAAASIGAAAPSAAMAAASVGIDVTVYPAPSPNAAVITQGANQYSYDPNGGNTNGQTVTALPSYTDPGARFVMTNTLIQRSDFPVRVYYRSIPGWSCFIFEYGDISDQSDLNLPPYSATVGGQVFNLSLGHWKFARWRWQSAAWPFSVPSISSLVAAGKLPKYDPTLVNDPTNWSPVVYTPMLVDPMLHDMGSPGGRGEIGVIPDWIARYICNPTVPQYLTDTLNIGEICGSWPILNRTSPTGPVVDLTTSSPSIVQAANYSQGNFTFNGPPGTVIQVTNTLANKFNVDANGQFWVYGNVTIPSSGTITVAARTAGANNNVPVGTATLEVPVSGVTITYDTTVWSLGSALGLDSGHWPEMSYVPWLLTGDPYYLEGLQSEVMNYFVWGNPDYNLGHPTGWGQTRAMAWSLRNMVLACAGTPANPGVNWLLPKATMENTLALNLPAYQKIIAGQCDQETLHPGSQTAFHTFNASLGATTDQYDPTKTVVAYAALSVYESWQEDFMCDALSLVIFFGYSNWLPILQWGMYNTLGRTTQGGPWDYRITSTYQTAFQNNSAGPPYPDWATANTANLIDWATYQGYGSNGGTPPTYDPTQIPPWGGTGCQDYVGGSMAALGLLWQATGSSQAAANAAFVATCRSVFQIQYEKCFAHS